MDLIWDLWILLYAYGTAVSILTRKLTFSSFTCMLGWKAKCWQYRLQIKQVLWLNSIDSASCALSKNNDILSSVQGHLHVCMYVCIFPYLSVSEEPNCETEGFCLSAFGKVYLSHRESGVQMGFCGCSWTGSVHHVQPLGLRQRCACSRPWACQWLSWLLLAAPGAVHCRGAGTLPLAPSPYKPCIPTHTLNIQPPDRMGAVAAGTAVPTSWLTNGSGGALFLWGKNPKANAKACIWSTGNWPWGCR